MLKSQKINCPKCGGSLFIRRDEYGPYVSCIQCGWCRDLGVGRPFPKGRGEDPEPLPRAADGCRVARSCFECPLPDCRWEAGTARAAFAREQEILAEYRQHQH